MTDLIGEQLVLDIPKQSPKKPKGYYLSQDIINFVKNEAEAYKVSENDVLTAIINYYRALKTNN